LLVYYSQTAIDCKYLTYGRASIAFNAQSAHEYIEVFSNIALELGDGLEAHWKKCMKTVLCRELRPSIARWTVHQYNKNLLPVTIADFHTLNYLLTRQFLELHSDWKREDIIRFYYKVIVRQEESRIEL